MPCYRYLEDSEVHVCDCSGTLSFDVGLAHLQLVASELKAHPSTRQRLLIDFRHTVWESDEVHLRLSEITRRDFDINADNPRLRTAIVNLRWQGAISDHEHWFLSESAALQWLTAGR